MIGCLCARCAGDVEDVEADRRRMLAAVVVVGHQHADLAGLVGADLDNRALARATRGSDHIYEGASWASGAEGELGRLRLLVDDARHIGIADRAVAEPYEHRVALMDHTDRLGPARD